MCACVCCGVQLLCLARVVLSKSRVVIIDEVMMVVNDGTEQILHRVVRTAFSDRTVINLSVNYLAPPTYMCTRGHQPVVNCPLPTYTGTRSHQPFFKLPLHTYGHRCFSNSPSTCMHSCHLHGKLPSLHPHSRGHQPLQPLSLDSCTPSSLFSLLAALINYALNHYQVPAHNN